MRLPWQKAPAAQLDLLDEKRDTASHLPRPASTESAGPTDESPKIAQRASVAAVGLPLCVPIGLIEEDPSNPRTEYPDTEIDELADDVRERGILQPLVVHPADAQGRYRLHFGAKRFRAALRAGLSAVPVVVREAPADAYDQVAENQKRHGLTPLDLARFIKSRVDAGESNAEIARRLGMNLTTVAHHLSLLDLPPALDQALKAGRCTSPRTLHELSQLHEVAPEQVQALVDGEAAITRAAVAELKADSAAREAKSKAARQADALSRVPTRLATGSNARWLGSMGHRRTRSRCPSWWPCASASKTSHATGCGGLTVRPRAPTPADWQEDDSGRGSKRRRAG